MKLHRLKMINFRQHAKTELILTSGITGIIGPNGSGKTTILEAIAWALYGNGAIRGTRDSIRFVGAAPRTQVEVELEFELAGHRYRVTRGLTTAAVYLDGSQHAIANSISGVNDLLQRRLGMTKSEFFSTYFTGQKELSVMASMGPTERAQFLSRVLGYERLRLAQDLIREQRRMIGAEITGLRSGMPDTETIERNVSEAESRLVEVIASSNDAGGKHAMALRELSEVTPKWEAIQKQREQLQRVLSDIALQEQESANVSAQIARIDKELTEIGPAEQEVVRLNEVVRPLAGYEAEVKELDEQFRQQGRRRTLIENAKILSEEMLALRERHSKLEQAPVLEEEVTLQLESKRKELEDVQTRLDQLRTEWVRDKQEAETKLGELRRQYGDAKSQRDQVVSLGADGICPTCNRKLGETFSTVVDQLNEQLQTLQVDGQYYRNRGEQLEKQPAELAPMEESRRLLMSEVAALEKKLTKIQIAVQELPLVFKELAAKELRLSETEKEIELLPANYDSARHQMVRGEIDRLAPLNKRLIQLSTAMERIPALQSDRDRLFLARETADVRLKELAVERASSAYSEMEYTRLRDSFEKGSQLARSTELAVVSAQGDVRSAQRVLDDAQAAQLEYKRVAESLKKLMDGRRLHDELDRTFADLRTDLNLQLRPELSDLASSFLAELTDDRYTHLELDNNYSILIFEDGRSKPVISGGEEDLANLVLRLAISQMIAERAGQAFSLLILDEVFGSLDVNRRDNVVELLRRIQDRFEQVILITHIDSIRDGVDQVIEVRHDEESGSSVVGSVFSG